MKRLLICLLVLSVALCFASADDQKGTRSLTVVHVVHVKPGMGLEFGKYLQKVIEAHKKLNIDLNAKVMFCIAGPAHEVLFAYELDKDAGQMLRTEGGILKRLVKVFGKEEGIKIWEAGAACIKCMERRLYVTVGKK